MRVHDLDLIRPADIRTSLALLTRLPVQARFERAARAAWAYPLAGTVRALCAGLVAGLALLIGLGLASLAYLRRRRN